MSSNFQEAPLNPEWVWQTKKIKNRKVKKQRIYILGWQYAKIFHTLAYSSFAIPSIYYYSRQDCRKARPAKPDNMSSISTPSPLCTTQALVSRDMCTIESYNLLKSLFDVISKAIQLISRWLLAPLNSTELSSRDIYTGRPGAQNTLYIILWYQSRSGRVRSKTESKRIKSGRIGWISTGRRCCQRCRTTRGSHPEHSSRQWLIKNPRRFGRHEITAKGKFWSK